MKTEYCVVIDKVSRARPEFWPGCHFSVSLIKLYGDMQWEGFDSILDRKGDKVTAENLELVVRKGDMTKEDLLELPQKRLF